MTRSDLPRLAGFPVRALAPGTRLYRVHRHVRDWMHFSVNGNGRFDLYREGALYVTEGPAASLLETARGVTLLSPAWRAERRLTTLVLGDVLRVADTTHPAAYAFGITNTIACGSGYREPQRLARDLVDAGFDGIRYLTRHDVAATERSAALFGTEAVRGVLGRSTVESHPISDGVLDAVRAYGIRDADDLSPDEEDGRSDAAAGGTVT